MPSIRSRFLYDVVLVETKVHPVSDTTVISITVSGAHSSSGVGSAPH